MKLTDEVRVQKLLLRGLSPAEVAEELKVSVSYVLKLIKRIREAGDEEVMKLCATNMLDWLTRTYKMRIAELWKIYGEAKKTHEKIQCLRMIKEEDSLMLETAEKFNLTGTKTDMDEFMKNLAIALSALSAYQRERVREVILRAVSDGVRIPGSPREVIESKTVGDKK